MIQVQTIVKVVDNTGAKEAMCVKVLGGSKRRYAKIGDIIVLAVKKALPRGIVKKKAVVKGVIVRTKKELRREDGSYIRFDDNAVVIVDNDGNPKGTRVFGPIARELRKKGIYQQILSQALTVI